MTDLRSQIQDPRRQHAMGVREQILRGIRAFFHERNFRETQTPIRVPNPGMETHLRPFQLKDGHYLHTSPEFAMKALLVGGLSRIFQLCPVFRDEPMSKTHQPEFTMLEWYRVDVNEHTIMQDTEALICELAARPTITYQGSVIDLTPPWPRLRVKDLFAEHCGIRLGTGEELLDQCRQNGYPVKADDTFDDWFFQLWLDKIEPRLPPNRPVFITDYPPEQAALARTRRKQDGLWAARFELFMGGLELANAFYELADPIEQRKRFANDMAAREAHYNDFPATPMPEFFLSALQEGMPEAAGIALGVDRLVMLMADESDLSYCQWLPAV